VTVGGVVLTGGRSTRMGTSKADLGWQGTTLLARTCAILAAALDGPVVVVRARSQQLPPLPDDVEVLEDERVGQGPLHGLAVGLHALEQRVDVGFVCATDLPFLHAAFVARVVSLADANPVAGAVVPVVHGHTHPLAAAYRTSLAAPAADAVEAGRLRLRSFLEEHHVLHVPAEELCADAALAAADPQLWSVTNVNDQRDYARALAANRG